MAFMQDGRVDEAECVMIRAAAFIAALIMLVVTLSGCWSGRRLLMVVVVVVVLTGTRYVLAKLIEAHSVDPADVELARSSW